MGKIKDMNYYIWSVLSDPIILDKIESYPVWRTSTESIYTGSSVLTDIINCAKSAGVTDDCWLAADEYGDYKLMYSVQIKNDSEYIFQYKSKRFSGVVFAELYKKLSEEGSGYIRHGSNSKRFRDLGFNDKDLYNLYLEGRFEEISKYYSLFFKRLGTITN